MDTVDVGIKHTSPPQEAGTCPAEELLHGVRGFGLLFLLKFRRGCLGLLGACLQSIPGECNCMHSPLVPFKLEIIAYLQ